MLTNFSQRWRERRASYRPAGEVIDTSKYEVVEIASDALARDFVVRHHYAATYPAARERFGLYRGADLVGCAVFSHPCSDKVLTNVFACDTSESIELGRFVLLDDVPANGESWFLARCFERLRAKGIQGVVSFSDPVPRTDVAGRAIFGGHAGCVYQASSAVYLGRATARTLRLLPDGRVFSDRAAQKIRKLEQGWTYSAAQLVAAGASPLSESTTEAEAKDWLTRALAQTTRGLRHAGNFKYAWAFHRTLRRTLPTSLPYPKLTLVNRQLSFVQ